MLTHLPRVPATAIRQRLAAAGFRPIPPARLLQCERIEEVYERTHDRDARYRVIVRTAIRPDRPDHPEPMDAIHIVAMFDRGPELVELPIFTAVAVPRTGNPNQVLDRMIERAREAYAAINQHRRSI